MTDNDKELFGLLSIGAQSDLLKIDVANTTVERKLYFPLVQHSLQKAVIENLSLASKSALHKSIFDFKISFYHYAGNMLLCLVWTLLIKVKTNKTQQVLKQQLSTPTSCSENGVFLRA